MERSYVVWEIALCKHVRNYETESLALGEAQNYANHFIFFHSITRPVIEHGELSSRDVSVFLSQNFVHLPTNTNRNSIFLSCLFWSNKATAGLMQKAKSRSEIIWVFFGTSSSTASKRNPFSSEL
jgi:hypothetical protein